MSIKLEEMMDEFRYPAQITTDKDVEIGGDLTVSGTSTLAGVSTLTTGSAGAFVVNGALTVTAAAVMQSTLTATGTSGSIYLGSGGPSISIVSITGAGALPDITAVTGSIAVNLSGTGPASRMYIAKGGGSAWTNIVAGA